MRTILYTMHFRGCMSPAGMDSKLLRTSGSVTSCVVSTTIGSTGVEVRPPRGESAHSRLRGDKRARFQGVAAKATPGL